MKKQYCSNILQGHTSQKSPSFQWKNFHGKSAKILRTAPIYPHVTPYFWPLKISWNVKDLSMTRQCRLQWKTFYRKKPKNFYTEVIHSLLSRWDQCISINAIYVQVSCYTLTVIQTFVIYNCSLLFIWSHFVYIYIYTL